MSFRDCIQSAIDAGRVSEKNGQRAQEAFDEALERGLAEGLDEGTAAFQASKQAVESISNLDSTRRWQKVKQMQSAHQIMKRLEGADDPGRELRDIMLEVENSYENVRATAMSGLGAYLRKYKPRALRPSRTDGLDDIVRAVFGEGGDAEAQASAKALLEVQDLLRKWANLHGATIPDSPNARLFQTHDAVKVDNVRKYTLKDGTETNTWVEEHLQPGVLDWEVMRFEGKPIAEGQRREVLMRTYEGIISDGALREKYLIEGGTPNLASRLNRDRFLHYANADAWLTMQTKYGSGNLFEQTIGMVDQMAKDISMLRTFGPSPNSMAEFAVRVAEQRAARIGNAKGADKQATLQQARRDAKAFKEMLEIHDRKVTSADGNFLVQAISGFRTVAVGSKLGGVLIPSFFGDLTNAKIMSKLTGVPQMGLVRRYFDEVAGGAVAQDDAVRLGVIYDNAIGLAHSRIRYFGALDGPHAARVFSDQVYRIGLASAHTQVARNAVGKQFLGFLHDTKGIAWENHPTAAFFEQLGITKSDWDAFRSQPSAEVSGAKFLVPLDMFRSGGRSEQQIAEKFGNAMQAYIRRAVPDTNLDSRRAAGEAIDPNSPWGQIARTMTSLLSFPIALHYNQLRAIRDLPNIRDKMTYAAAYFTFMTASGAIITQAKALASGQQLYNMNPFTQDATETLDFWGRAMLNGGSMGILGDVLMNWININNSQYRPGDPTTELLKSVHKLTLDNMIDMANGDEVEGVKDALDLGNQLIPRFWHTKVIFERELMDAAEREYDPAGYRRAKQYEREHAEGMWWGQGEDPQAIRLETAVGG